VSYSDAEWDDIMSLCIGESGGRLAFGGVEVDYLNDTDEGVLWTPMRTIGMCLASSAH